MQQILLLEGKSKVNNYNFFSIKEQIVNWYNEQFYNQKGVTISKNTEDILIIDFDFTKCLAQLTVSRNNNNPFQFIYFEAIDLEKENKIYCFFDNENMNQREVINALSKAYNYCLNYEVRGC